MGVYVHKLYLIALFNEIVEFTVNLLRIYLNLMLDTSNFSNNLKILFLLSIRIHLFLNIAQFI